MQPPRHREGVIQTGGVPYSTRIYRLDGDDDELEFVDALTLPANILLYTELAFPKETQVKLSWDGLFTTISLVIVGIFSGLFVGKTYPRYTQEN